MLPPGGSHMRGPFLLAIDQGTTSSRALVVASDGTVASVGQRELPQIYPRPGWVEHDPLAIWSSTCDAIEEALGAAGLAASDLAAIGIANQRETVMLWARRTGEPVGNAIVWQDRRTADHCDALREAGYEETVAQLTGLTLDPYFSGTKLAWMLKADADLARRAERGELVAGTADTWLIWQLTAGARFVTDYTNASRTLLFDIHRAYWSDELCGILGVPAALLPEVLPSGALFGRTAAQVFGAEVPILGVAGDQQAATVGQGCLAPGLAKNTYGTGCFLLANAGTRSEPSRHRMLVSLAASLPDQPLEYVIEGSVFVAGAAVQWLRDELGVIQSAAEVEPLAASVPDTGGVEFVPAFTGLGAPHWDAGARGAIFGLTRGSGKAHIARAALEAIALSTVDLLGAVEADLGAPISELRVDGGAARNDLLMQLQADLSGIPIVRPVNTETTAMGVAYLAGIGAGLWDELETIDSLREIDRVFEPAIDADARLERLDSWHRAVERTRGWASA